MKKHRKLFAFVGLIAGIGLVYFELAHRRAASAGEFSFWLVVAGLLILLAMIDLFARPADPS